MMKIALLCCGLGNIKRGHEVFAADLHALLRDSVDITLFKGAGPESRQQHVVDHIPRNSPLLDHVHPAASPKWLASATEQERLRVEMVTFAYAALKPLLEGDFDVIHCLEREVCNIIYEHRHLFRRTPKILFSNGGALPARELPKCDFVQEHTAHNLKFSAKTKAFMIPHGVDIDKFHPGVDTEFRSAHGFPEDALVVISVGTICYQHKRMDYVIREVAAVAGAYLLIIGQDSDDSPAIRELGSRLMGTRIVFATLPHEQLPSAYAAANVFVLGSTFETFGIAYIEAMAMGLPVICTNHVNQRSIVKEGVFIDMTKSGALTAALNETSGAELTRIGRRARDIAIANYDLRLLKTAYLARYEEISRADVSIPPYTLGKRALSNCRNAMRQLGRMVHGRAR